MTCFASVFDLDLSEILKEEDYRSRLKLLLRQIASYPPSILFSDQPRLDIDGLRWAPARLGARDNLGGYYLAPEDCVPLLQEGLMIPRPGLLFHERVLPKEGVFRCLTAQNPRNFTAVLHDASDKALRLLRERLRRNLL